MTAEKTGKPEKTRDGTARDHRGHRRRMAKRFAEGGFDGWREHEILERLLFEVLPRRNTNGTAHALIRAFGSLRGVLTARPEALARIPGIGPVSARFLAGLLPRFTENLLAPMREKPVSDGTLLVLADWFLRFLAHPAAYVFLAPDGRLRGAAPANGPASADRADGKPDPESGAAAGERTILLIREEDASPELIRVLAGRLHPRPDAVRALTKNRELREYDV